VVVVVVKVMAVVTVEVVAVAIVVCGVCMCAKRGTTFSRSCSAVDCAFMAATPGSSDVRKTAMKDRSGALAVSVTAGGTG